ncbi:MAG: surface carbohydrate biosynthesis protein [Armatimonadota bacterium]
MGSSRIGRVCLIVDHPLRDLDGLVLVACELARRNLEAILVPMYHRHEVFLLRPDLVLVNYIRFANVGFIETCRRLGIRVGVLDTEGGVQKDVGAFARRICPYLDHVSLYCTWGRVQQEALRACQANGEAVVATGCPRYDFAASPWREAIRDGAPGMRDLILVNTNFPIVNPRFQSSRREAVELVKGMRFEQDYVDELFRQTLAARSALVDATRDLAARFPRTPVVVRPHPFEDPTVYEPLLRASNIAVIQQGTVFEWIRKAAVVVHHNCSTAIEAFLMGREPLHAGWIDTPLLVQPLSVAVSQQAQSPAHMAELVGRVLDGKALAVPDDVRASRRRVIDDFFYANDGKAFARIADAATRLLKGSAGVGTNGRGFRSTWRHLAAQAGWREMMRHLVVLIGGTGLHERLQAFLRPERRTPAKQFGVEEVEEVVRRLGHVRSEYRQVVVETADGRGAAFPVKGRLSSVRIHLS